MRRGMWRGGGGREGKRARCYLGLCREARLDALPDGRHEPHGRPAILTGARHGRAPTLFAQCKGSSGTQRQTAADTDASLGAQYNSDGMSRALRHGLTALPSQPPIRSFLPTLERVPITTSNWAKFRLPPRIESDLLPDLQRVCLYFAEVGFWAAQKFSWTDPRGFSSLFQRGELEVAEDCLHHSLALLSCSRRPAF